MHSPTSATAGAHVRMTDPSLRDIVLVDQLPSDAWAEGLIVRPSGACLATRIDGGELYSIPPPTDEEDDVAEVIYTFPARCTLNICRLKSSGSGKEDYAVLTAHIDFSTQAYHSTVIWRITFDSSESNKPEVSKIADLPKAVFCLGMEQVTDDVLLVMDPSAFCIWRIRLASGDVSVLFSDDATMRPKTSEEMFGGNRLRLMGGYIYYTNTSTGCLHRVPAEVRNGDVAITGSVQTLLPNGSLDNADGLAIARDGRTGYATSYVDGLLRRIDIDPEKGTALVTTLIDDIISPTATDLVYKDGDDKPTLYVACCGAVSKSLMDSMGNIGFDYAGVDKKRLKLEVMVTTEITVTYETVT